MKEYKYFSDEEQRDYNSACVSVSKEIDAIVHYLQKELRLSAFTPRFREDLQGYNELNVKYNYLDTLAGLIKSQADKLQETK